MLLQDLRQTLRLIRQRPGFVGAVVLTLGLGIGANTGIFTLVDTVLLRPLPYDSPDRLVRVLRTHPTARFTMFSYPDLRDLRSASATLEEVGGYATTRWFLGGVEDPAVLPGTRVTEGFFDVLGIEPLAGRLFTEADFEEGQERVVVLSYEAWRGRFGGDPEILGRTIELQGTRFTVIGVLRPGAVRYPSPDIAFWVPASTSRNEGRGSRWLNVIGRLGPEIELEAARSEARLIAERLAAEYPEANEERTITMEPLRDSIVADVRTLFLVLLAAVGTVLLIACANVANLLLARATGRGREVAIRLALGADRRRLLYHLLSESVTLSLLGGIAGIGLAVWLVDAFVAVSPGELPRQMEIGVDLRVMGFALALSLVTGIAAGFVPALQASRPDLTGALKEGDVRAGAGGKGRRLRGALAGAQIALSVVLLVGAGLLIKSLWRLQSVDPGFQPESVVSASVLAPSSRYPDPGAALALFDRLTSRLEALPGVTDAAVASMIPLSGANWCNDFMVEGRDDFESDCAEFRAVSPGYFRVMGIPMVRGRALRGSDDAGSPRVAVVNEAMARRFWSGGEVLGQRVRMFREAWEIVGVVGDVRDFGLDRDVKPTVFMPFGQRPVDFANVVARATIDPTALLGTVRGAIRDIDPQLPIYELTTLENLLSRSVATPRFRTALLGGLAALALVLAAIGIYGVMAYDVGRRTREIGIRMAMGARRPDVLRQVLGQAGGVTAIGVVLGLVGAAAATRALSGFLFAVEPLDTAVFVAVPVFLAAVALCATLIPARRATRVDPMTALRHE